MTLGIRIGLVLLLLTGPLSARANPPIIESASLVGGALHIHGMTFGATKGTSTVTLGGVALTGFVSWSRTDVTVTVSASPGSYLLVLKTSGGTASFDVTVGAVGPAGPPGPRGDVGPQGPPGMSAPTCRDRPGGTCSISTTQACAYDKNCPTGERCLDPAPRFVHGNGTVKDMRTCLEWEKKTGTVGTTPTCWPGDPPGTICVQSADPHNVNNVYSFPDPDFNIGDSDGATFLAKLNTPPGFAGHTDWRLPTSGGDSYTPTGDDPELESILLDAASPCVTSPCIDTTVFGPSGLVEQVFSGYMSSSSAGEVSYWTVEFATGTHGIDHLWNWSLIRAVRGGPGVP